MSTPNYISIKKQAEIDEVIDSKLVEIGKSYPEDPLLDIIKAAIPGVKITLSDFEGEGGSSVRGAIFRKSDEFREPLIAIQQEITPEARTFALAHEFGHYLLDHPGDANFLLDKIDFDGTDEKQREAEAQYFAASLLMPKDRFTRLMHILSDEQLARRFGVSIAAVRIRKKWLYANSTSTAL